MRRGRVTVVGVALLALAVGPAESAPAPAVQPPAFWPPPVLSHERAIAAAVRVDSRGGGVFDSGTGVGIGAHVVLTNAHLTRNAVTLVTRCGDVELGVDRIDRAPAPDDVALLTTTGPNLVPVELAEHDPAPGDPVLLAGYPGGRLTLIEGQVDGTLRQDGVDLLRFSPEPRTGQSGSPLFDADGRLAGLAFAQDTAGGQGLAIPASRLRVLVDQQSDPAAAAARSSPCG